MSLTLTYKDITPDELRKSNYPDKKAFDATVDFKSQNGFGYWARYFIGNGKFIWLLGSYESSISDFKRVRGEIARHALGFYVSYSDVGILHGNVYLLRRSTQKNIADSIEQFYMKYFSDVEILSIYYLNISKQEFENATIPRNKLRSVEYKDHLLSAGLLVELYQEGDYLFKGLFPSIGESEQRQTIDMIIQLGTKQHKDGLDSWLDIHYPKLIEESGVLGVGRK